MLRNLSIGKNGDLLAKASDQYSFLLNSHARRAGATPLIWIALKMLHLARLSYQVDFIAWPPAVEFPIRDIL